jgi:hypothetical protein
MLVESETRSPGSCSRFRQSPHGSVRQRDDLEIELPHELQRISGRRNAWGRESDIARIQTQLLDVANVSFTDTEGR